jgi:predicted ArsR family transcriptional regulator
LEEPVVVKGRDTRSHLSLSIWKLLCSLAGRTATLRQLADDTEMTLDQVYTTLVRLEEKGLVERAALVKAHNALEGEGGRAVRSWRTTSAGNAEVVSFSRIVEAAVRRIGRYERKTMPDMPGHRPERTYPLSEVSAR